MANDTRLEVRLPEDLLAQVDAARGDVPRAVFVRRALERALAGPESVGDRLPAEPSPAPPRASEPKPAREDYEAAQKEAAQKTGRYLDDEEVVKRARQIAARRPKPASPALARQQALNKSKGI